MNEPAQNFSQNSWEPVFQDAVRFHGGGQLAEAASLFAAILEHNPDHFPSLHRLAAIRRHQDRFEESLALLQRAIGCNPTAADAYNSLGNTLNSLGRQEEALAQYRRAVALRENFPEAHLNLANSFKALERWHEAEAAYRAAIALRPGYVEAHTNLGIVSGRLNRPADALASFSAAVSFDPAVKLGNSNLATALIALNRHEEALPFLRRARQLEPDAPQPVFNESLVHLAMGNLERAWPGYEARLRIPELQIDPYNFAQPVWAGQSAIAGKTILLHAEQGLGDTILFARFVEPIVRKGARVIAAIQKPLVRLMSAMPGVAQVLTSGDPLPEFDLHAPFGSLPLALEITLDTIPARIPYLQAPAESETIASTDEKPDDPRPLVGVCWAGNSAYPNDHNRSIPLAIFARLFQVPGVRFVSLQQNLRPGDDSILARFDNIDLTSDRKGSGLADTAALMSRLDMVVTVDTVIGHLAGALGRPFWILLPYSAYWAWLRDRKDTPWYPTARLFRQPQPGDWKSVLESVADALKSMRPRPVSTVTGVATGETGVSQSAS
ncbi:MAG: tetratricopeptide repeat protein [Bryobacteraceae bacterium]|jgi:tetratricopeptide (TPR) repeat protein